jgi:cysteine-rich repeat protein
VTRGPGLLAAVLLLAPACIQDTYLAAPWDAAPLLCGNGSVDPGEGCDDGNTDDGDGCSATCTLEEVCTGGLDEDGDGLVDCADTVDCGADPACQAVCGDGVVEGAEICDDGNTVNGDGCSSSCQREPEADCLDGIDNNLDGTIDCADPTCDGMPCDVRTGLCQDATCVP